MDPYERLDEYGEPVGCHDPEFYRHNPKFARHEVKRKKRKQDGSADRSSLPLQPRK
jgi:hypothetical protein